MADGIRHLMFVVEDFLGVTRESITLLLSKVDRKVLCMALKGTSDELKKHFFSGMSNNAAEMLREDIEGLGPVKIKNVEAAQEQIISIARMLELDGVLSLRPNPAERYVL